jgi:putative ATP-dependent endonuclease of the OLD family
MRRVQPSDFHVPVGANPEHVDSELWLEVDIEFEETADQDGDHPSIPPFFTHMALEDASGVPHVRIRLTATLEVDEYVEEKLEYITQVDADGEPTQRSEMSRHDRAAIEVHYLPARRNPVDHIAFTAASLLGRMLRDAGWTDERDEMVRQAPRSFAVVLDPSPEALLRGVPMGCFPEPVRNRSGLVLWFDV